MKVPSLLTGKAERTRPLSEQIASAEDRYCWCFDHPVRVGAAGANALHHGLVRWPMRKEIRSIRARRGRQKFLGNYGIERKDVGAASERVGFAIAVPLPRGESHVTIEVQESDGVWRTISSRAVFGAPNGDSVAPIDLKYFIPNPGANPCIGS